MQGSMLITEQGVLHYTKLGLSASSSLLHIFVSLACTSSGWCTFIVLAHQSIKQLSHFVVAVIKEFHNTGNDILYIINQTTLLNWELLTSSTIKLITTWPLWCHDSFELSREKISKRVRSDMSLKRLQI